MLTRLFGVWGARLHESANGIDNSEVIEEYETKSIGRDTTFEEDADDEEQILRVLDELAEEVRGCDCQWFQVQDDYLLGSDISILTPILGPNPCCFQQMTWTCSRIMPSD